MTNARNSFTQIIITNESTSLTDSLAEQIKSDSSLPSPGDLQQMMIITVLT